MIETSYTELYRCAQARRRRLRFVKRLQSMTQWRYWSGAEQDAVFSMALSPDATRLATVHHSGRFSLWHLPALTLQQTWRLDEQVRARIII